MALDDARVLADRVATIWSAEAVNGFDEQGIDVLTRTLAKELPLMTSDRVSTLAATVADSARALATSRWREWGRERPETPTVDRSSVRGALLIHLHGLPDGPMSAALRQQHEEGLRLQAPRRRRRTPPPAREQVERFARALRAHEEELSIYLASLEGDL
jgi:hypothetical protein